MSQPERRKPPGQGGSSDVDVGFGLSPAATSRRYGRYVVLIGLVLAALAVTDTLLTPPRGADGIVPGERVPPFAVPLVTGTLEGDANVATRANEGSAGHRPACAVRGARILNVCELYERSPVVLALFVNGGACPAVLDEMQALAPSFPGVRFAAVSIKGERSALRRLVAAHGLRFPVGIDRDGVLTVLYKVSSCPQVNFVYPGGAVQSRALLATPSPAALRARVQALVAGARARGWRG
ncbi:MAG: TlpA family protein disulfide reductase [Solirubrobacterales bacterium]